MRKIYIDYDGVDDVRFGISVFPYPLIVSDIGSIGVLEMTAIAIDIKSFIVFLEVTNKADKLSFIESTFEGGFGELNGFLFGHG